MVSMKLIPRWFSISVKEERVNRCTARDILSPFRSGKVQLRA